MSKQQEQEHENENDNIFIPVSVSMRKSDLATIDKILADHKDRFRNRSHVITHLMSRGLNEFFEDQSIKELFGGK